MLRQGTCLPPTVDTFARLVLVHAIYQHSAGLHSTAYKNPFFSTRPTDDYISEHRNNTIKMMETLQDQGLSNGQDQGTELLAASLQCHTLLVLMLLHAPRKDLLAFAHSTRTEQEEQDDLRLRLEQWMREDGGRSARVAVGLAGRILALVRRLPSCSFHVPPSLLLAVLVLWAFNQLLRRALDNNSSDATNGTHNMAQQEHGVPNERFRGSTIRLDRPGTTTLEIGDSASREMRAWVDGIAGLKPCLHDLGNICKPSAGPRLLELGSNMLKNMRAWGLGPSLASWLTELKARCEPMVDS